MQISPKLTDVTNGEFLFYIPETWNRNTACTCVDIQRNLGIGVDSSRCHLLSSIEIPARNDALWEANLAMFQKTLEANEKTFWTKHFGKSKLNKPEVNAERFINIFGYRDENWNAFGQLAAKPR